MFIRSFVTLKSEFFLKKWGIKYGIPKPAIDTYIDT